MISEEEYAEMENAERRSKAILKANNYRTQELKCCGSCEHCGHGYPEEGATCSLAEQDGWTFGAVDDLNICDRWGTKRR